MVSKSILIPILLLKSAIETAIYDALGKKLNVSVDTLLGRIIRNELGVAWTLASYDTQRDIASHQSD
jgi:muconate cycloisomerase